MWSIVVVQVLQSNFSSNKAINGAGVSIQQVTSMSMYNVSIRVSPFVAAAFGTAVPSQLIAALLPKAVAALLPKAVNTSELMLCCA